MRIMDLETALTGNYTMVFDDTVVPAGTVKHVDNDTKEEVIVIMNKEVYERCNKATNNTVSKKEETNMKATNNTINTAANTTTNKEDAVMEKKTGLFEGFFNNFANSFKAAYDAQTSDLDEAREAGKEVGRKVAGVVYRPAYVAGYAVETLTGLVEECGPIQDIKYSAQKGFEDGRAAKVRHDSEKLADNMFDDDFDDDEEFAPVVRQ